VVWGQGGKTGTQPKKPLPLGVRRAVAGLLVVIAVWVGWSMASDFLLYRRGAQLERDIAADQVTDPGDIWNRWTELSKGNSSSWLLHGPRKVVEQRLVAAADRVIDTDRKSDTVHEISWKGARDDLAHALALDPENTVRGKLRLIEGHLARINGTSHRSVADLNEAVEKFTEADLLMPKSADPELGLARVYVYGLKDIDKAYDALQKAESRGYPLGNRENAQLADGYRDRADRLFWDSRNVRGMPQEKDQSERAKQDYSRALGLYQTVAPYGNANTQIVRVQNSLDSVNFRLQQIEEEGNQGGNGDPLSALPRKVPPWIHSLLRDIWQSRAAKQ
jgi:tetratricopeptide (TPR) repeat protein